MQITTDTRRFHAADPVGVYWLAHCEGFVVASPSGTPVATVDDHVFDPAVGETVALAVSHGKRQSVLPTEAVTTVVPAAGTLLVDVPTYERLRPAWRAALDHAVEALRATASAVQRWRRGA